MDTQRQDQAEIHVVVDGKPTPFVFKKKDGGKFGSEGSKTFPGGMRPQKAHGGPAVVEDVSFEAEFVPARDHAEIQRMKQRRGKGKAKANEIILDEDGNAWGQGDDWSGILSGIDTGSYDSSSSEPKSFTIEIETDGE
ncbi:MAG TPA: hypothetical protein VMS60_15870 [Solirubrobacterales bacterium]|nr:hypothetical protein [Solirubrobacterales bacterium]